MSEDLQSYYVLTSVNCCIISRLSCNSCERATKHAQIQLWTVSPQTITKSGNLTLHSEQSGKTLAELRGNQKENDLEIQGDQMVALLGAEAAGLKRMKAWSVLGLTGQVRRDTQ